MFLKSFKNQSVDGYSSWCITLKSKIANNCRLESTIQPEFEVWVGVNVEVGVGVEAELAQFKHGWLFIIASIRFSSVLLQTVRDPSLTIIPLIILHEAQSVCIPTTHPHIPLYCVNPILFGMIFIISTVSWVHSLQLFPKSRNIHVL